MTSNRNSTDWVVLADNCNNCFRESFHKSRVTAFYRAFAINLGFPSKSSCSCAQDPNHRALWLNVSSNKSKPITLTKNEPEFVGFKHQFPPAGLQNCSERIFELMFQRFVTTHLFLAHLKGDSLVLFLYLLAFLIITDIRPGRRRNTDFSPTSWSLWPIYTKGNTWRCET